MNRRTLVNRRTLGLAALATLAAGPLAAQGANPLQDGPTWDELRGDVVGEAEILDGAGLVDLDAPYRAEDAATVPITLRQLDPGLKIDRATVVVDENPSPVVAEITLAPAMLPLDFEMRVRVNQYSDVRLLAETDRGLLMAGRFVKASGGCSAPASRDPEAALASMGEMKARLFGAAPQQSSQRAEAQIMIRHPNYSGLQRDQITQLFIPAHFIDHLEVLQGDEPLFTVDGGISISENPVFRFTYADNGSTDFVVRAHDTEGNSFEHVLPKAAAG